MSKLDYSKWNNLHLSDDSEEHYNVEDYEEEQCLAHQQAKALRPILIPSSPSHVSKKKNKVNGTTKAAPQIVIKRSDIITHLPELPAHYIGSPVQRMQYSEGWRVHRTFFETNPHLVFDPKIHIHIKDKLADIHPIFFSDPAKFTPKRNSEGLFVEWAIQDVYEDFIAFNRRRMSTQFLYGPTAVDSTDYVELEPAVQFITTLAYRKELEILKYRTLNTKKYTPDYLLEISIRSVHPRVWRQIKVSSSISLSILHDKVLAPAFGWVRNYHGYIFTDQRDAALFGPIDSNAVDMMHLPMNGFLLLDDKKFNLCDLLRRVGDTLSYTYDLGDHFEHEIRLLSTCSPSESNGKCFVFDGAMASLPEDSIGSPLYKGHLGYQGLIDEWSKLGHKKRTRLQETIAQALNYQSEAYFDPFKFDLAACQARLKNAFGSKASIPKYSTSVNWPTDPGFGSVPKIVRKGNIREITSLMENGISFLKETIKSCRDSKGNTLCSSCGNPSKLRACGGCRMIWYCSTECQSVHWLQHKKKCHLKRNKKYSA